jgi:excisionase family DNA binding protein
MSSLSRPCAVREPVMSATAQVEAYRTSGQSPGQSDVQPRTAARSHSSQLHPHSSAPRLLTLREAADYLAVSYWTVRSWVESGKLPHVRLPGSRLLRVERVDLDRFIDAHKVA